MKKLIIIRGSLGVGKTTVSKILSQRLDLDYLSLDKIIDDNHLVVPGTDGVPLQSYLAANQIIFDVVNNGEKTFIVDGCFYYQEQLDDLMKKFNNNIEIFTLVGSIETCIQRDAQRLKVYGEDAARFVHMMTAKIHIGLEIDTTKQTSEETVEDILERI